MEKKSGGKIKWLGENSLVLKIRYNEKEDKTIAEYYETINKDYMIELIPQGKRCEIPGDCVEGFNLRWGLNKK